MFKPRNIFLMAVLFVGALLLFPAHAQGQVVGYSTCVDNMTLRVSVDSDIQFNNTVIPFVVNSTITCEGGCENNQCNPTQKDQNIYIGLGIVVLAIIVFLIIKAKR